MAGFGKVNEFNPDTEDVNTYLMRLKHFMISNHVKDEEKVSFLITILGSKVISTLVDLFSPEALDSKTYDEIIDKFKQHYQPEKLNVAERSKFYSRRQQTGESVLEYIVSLKHLASTCHFGNFLEDALRDRLISGVSQEDLRQKLISEEITFSKACDIALKFEEAEKQKFLFGQSSFSTVNTVRYPQRFGKFNKPTDETKVNKSERVKTDRSKFCTRCNSNSHVQYRCPYKNFDCRKCKNKGHLARACRTRVRKRVNEIVEGSSESDCSSDEKVNQKDIFGVKDTKPTEVSKKKGWYYNLIIEGVNLEMQIDTGACIAILPEHIYKAIPQLSAKRMTKADISLNTYQGKSISVLGNILVEVQHEGKLLTLPLLVVQSNDKTVPALLGRNWLEVLKINWNSVFGIEETPNKIKIDSEVLKLKQKYASVFSGEVGEIKGKEVVLHLKENAVPKFCKARPLPFALKPEVDKELEKLQKSGIIYKVPHSEWATPIVVVRKPQNAIRMCADYKVTLNPVLETEHYKLPTTEELFSHLANGKIFSHLDLKSAYQQLSVNTKSQKLLTINTHRGLFTFRRLPFGISSAPSLFQEVMDDILKDIPGVICYLDDVLLVSKSMKEGVQILEKVLERFEKAGITVNFKKCKFLCTETTYLGYTVNSEGISPTHVMVDAIKKAPEPKNIEELRAYLGLLNFYGKFIPQLSTKIYKLYELLKNVPWAWTAEHSVIFENSKNWLTSDLVLVHFDSTKQLILTCDASQSGVAGVLSHLMENGEERPIMFASKTLSTAEKSYSQIEKEALAIIFSVKKFHKYLSGNNFILYTDHKPLTTILGEKKGIPTIAAARLQRWAIILSAYQYEIKFKKGKDIGNADALSRLPIQDDLNMVEDFSGISELEKLIFYFSSDSINDVPITAADIALKTKEDRILSKVLHLTLQGWPGRTGNEELAPYEVRQNEISIEQNCLTWGDRVIIPESLRPKLIQLLHEDHIGITRTKMLARNFMWWPNMDQTLEEVIKSCSICQAVQNSNKESLQPWPEAKRRWQRLHIDYAKDSSDCLITTNSGHYLLCVIDSYSKWVEVFLMNKTTSGHTIEKLRTLFASFGIPELLVSDNGPQFVSEEFKQFLKKNGIKQALIPPYHSASNGAAERTVQTVKKALLKQVLEDIKDGTRRGIQHKLDNFLFSYRNTPQTTTGKTPAELFLQRRPRTKLSMILPNLAENVEKRQDNEQSIEEKTFRFFKPGDSVLVRSVRGEKVKWFPGTILNCRSRVTYDVMVQGQKRYCHVDHLRDAPNNSYPFFRSLPDPCPISRPGIQTTPESLHPKTTTEEPQAVSQDAARTPKLTTSPRLNRSLKDSSPEVSKTSDASADVSKTAQTTPTKNDRIRRSERSRRSPERWTYTSL